MEYVQSLLDEYYDLSQKLETLGGPEKDANLHDEILSVEEEICWEFSLPASTGNRSLFRFIDKKESKQSYIQNALETLVRAKAKYFFHSEASVAALFKAA
jgi:hypothetical protein